MRRERVAPRPHEHLGRCALALVLQVDDPGHAAERGRDPRAGRVERVEVVPEHVHDDGGRLAGQALAEAVAEESHDLGAHTGIAFDDLADRSLGFRLIDPRRGLELDVELAAVRAPSVLAELGAADLLRDRRDVRQREDLGADSSANPEHLVERSAGQRAARLDDEVPLLELGHELAAEPRQ